mgnify:CR=1 FL=1
MIDTDKYEGHTPAPWLWYVDDGDVDLVVADDQCRTVIEEVKELNIWADAELIADAPLLLAEVKRLREALVGDSKDWTTDELVEKIFTLYDKAHAWDKMVEYYSENEGTEDDSQADWEMREEMERVLEEVKK